MPGPVVLIDGFPRNFGNVEEYEKEFGPLMYMIALDCSEATMLQRLRARLRDDDSEDIIRKRLEGYRKETVPLITLFRKIPDRKIVTVNGDRDRHAVYRDVRQAYLAMTSTLR